MPVLACPYVDLLSSSDFDVYNNAGSDKSGICPDWPIDKVPVPFVSGWEYEGDKWMGRAGSQSTQFPPGSVVMTVYLEGISAFVTGNTQRPTVNEYVAFYTAQGWSVVKQGCGPTDGSAEVLFNEHNGWDLEVSVGGDGAPMDTVRITNYGGAPAEYNRMSSNC